MCLVPVMALMWLATSACVLAALPGLGPLPALIIGAWVTSTDPILSQAIAKGPFADKFVARALREVISAEAGANDGFASPFLGLALTLLLQQRHGGGGGGGGSDGSDGPVAARALRAWLLETLLYTVLLALAYGALAGYLAGGMPTSSPRPISCLLSHPHPPPNRHQLTSPLFPHLKALRPRHLRRARHERPAGVLHGRVRAQLGRSVPGGDAATARRLQLVHRRAAEPGGFRLHRHDGAVGLVRARW